MQTHKTHSYCARIVSIWVPPKGICHHASTDTDVAVRADSLQHHANKPTPPHTHQSEVPSEGAREDHGLDAAL